VDTPQGEINPRQL